MSFAKSMLSPETETREQEPELLDHRMSLEDAIQEYVRIDLRYQELAEEKKRWVRRSQARRERIHPSKLKARCGEYR